MSSRLVDPAQAHGSYRQIIRSSSIVGGASMVQLGLGLLRMKAAALIVGVTGVGLIGLLNNLVTAAAAVGGLGIASSATRQIAAERSRSGEDGESVARRALASATIVLPIVTAALVWLFREPIQRLALGSAVPSAVVGWLGIGAGLTIIAASQTALLAGLRKMGAMGQAIVLGGIIATIAGVGALVLLGSNGIVFFVIALPLANVLAGAWYVMRLPRPVTSRLKPQQLWPQWRQLMALGTAFMLAQLLANGAQLAARVLIQQRLGPVDLGLFQASWAVTTTYLAVVLQAMGADYYPRLAEVIDRPDAAARVVNEQTEVALLLGAPIILAALALAPIGLDILYSSAFRPASELLRWQIMGDVLKVGSWPMGYVLLAANRGRTFLAMEALTWTIFLVTTWVLLPFLGLEAAGVGYVVMYLIYLPAMTVVTRTTISRGWTSTMLRHSAIVAAAGAAVFVLLSYRETTGAILGLAAAGAFAVVAAVRLRSRIRPT
jgi:PST family polysaccharide transporter